MITKKNRIKKAMAYGGITKTTREIDLDPPGIHTKIPDIIDNNSNFNWTKFHNKARSIRDMGSGVEKEMKKEEFTEETNQLIKKYIGKENYLDEYLSTGAAGPAFITETGTVMKFTNVGGEAAVALAMALAGKKLKSNARVFKVYQLDLSGQRFWIIEKELLDVIENYLKDEDASGYEETITNSLKTNYSSFENFKDQLSQYVKLKRLFKTKPKFMQSVYEFYKGFKEDESTLRTELYDLHSGNVGMRGDKILCFDCIWRGAAYSLKKGGKADDLGRANKGKRNKWTGKKRLKKLKNDRIEKSKENDFHYWEKDFGGSMANGGGIKNKRDRVVDYFIQNDDNDDLLVKMGYVEEGKERGMKLLKDRNKNYDAIFERISTGYTDNDIATYFDDLGLEELSSGGSMANGEKFGVKNGKEWFDWRNMDFNERLQLAIESDLRNPSKVAITELGLLTPDQISSMKNSVRLRTETMSKLFLKRKDPNSIKIGDVLYRVYYKYEGEGKEIYISADDEKNAEAIWRIAVRGTNENVELINIHKLKINDDETLQGIKYEIGETSFVEMENQQGYVLAGGGGVKRDFITKMELIENPMVKSHSMFGNQQTFIDEINRNKQIIADTGYNSKTSLHISIQSGENRYGINNEVEGLKYLVKEEPNYFAGGINRNAYLKAKSLDDIHWHIEQNIAKLLPSVQLQGLTIKLYKTPPIVNLINTGKLEHGGDIGTLVKSKEHRLQ